MSFLIRDYDSARDGHRLRQCVVELQEFERRLEPSLPQGEAMADPYLAFLLERCARSSGRILVAEKDNTVAGLVAVLTRVSPEEPDEARQEYAYISDLVVVARYRGRGLGRILLEHAEALARKSGATTLRVGVLAKNHIAHGLYQQLGFNDFQVQMVKDL